MAERPVIHTGGIGEAIAVGEYLRQRYPDEAIVSAVGEVVDDQGIRAYLPTFVEEAARVHRGEGFDGFNLSDIFEYLDSGASAAIYDRLLDAARPGARFAYWNMLVPRRLGRTYPHRVRALDEEAKALFARDLAFFYSAFVLEEAL